MSPERRDNARAEALLPQLNADQRRAFDAIVAALQPLHRADRRAFFVDGPGGTGKTFLYDILLAYVRGIGRIALAVGGTTAHMRLKIPITLDANSTCKCASHYACLALLLPVPCDMPRGAPQAAAPLRRHRAAPADRVDRVG